MMCSNGEILKRIEQLRKQMLNTVHEQGFTSERTITISQKIDRLLNKYNENNQKK